MKVRIITIGDEILIGQIVDSNSAYIAQKLNDIGLEVEEILSIKDEEECIIQTLERLKSTTDIFITTGGLGPTRDDKTKNALCRLLGVDLVYDEEVLNYLQERYQKAGRIFNNLNRDQALVPKGTIALHNPLGTAPGLWNKWGNSIIINLQGVPFEMKYLMRNEVIPRLKSTFSLPFVVHRFLSVSNYPESELAIAMEEWENSLPSYMQVAYLPENSKVRLRITARGENQEFLINQIQQKVDELIPLIGERLDSTIQDSIAIILGELLKEKGWSIASAESCTGGEIARLLTAVPGSSNFYHGTVVSYATEVKINVLNVPEEIIEKYTVVSREVAEAMADGVQKLLKTEVAVTTTGVAGPAKGEDGKEVGTIWMAVKILDKVYSKSYFFPYLEREDFINQVSKLALQFAYKLIREGRA